jgi:hypothetical protein
VPTTGKGKRYPQYDHVAVIVAEDITSRFLNVTGLFNGFIPLVAIQLSAIKLGDAVSLVFSKVIDEARLGLVDEDEEVRVPADRGYWEKRGSKQTLAMADEMFGMAARSRSGARAQVQQVLRRPCEGWPTKQLRHIPASEGLAPRGSPARTV